MVVTIWGCASKNTTIRPSSKISIAESEEEGDETGKALPVLIDADRAVDAVVESNRTGRPRTDIEELREMLCEGRGAEPIIFYQLIVSRHWHYYWLCSSRIPLRAATTKGTQQLAKWLDRMDHQAKLQSAECVTKNQRSLFSMRHESGIRATAQCNGRIILRFPDGEKKTRFFVSNVEEGKSPPKDAVDEETVSQQQCPACPLCPTCPRAEGCPLSPPCPVQQECPLCPKCLPQKDCPKMQSSPDLDCRSFGQAAFAQGVRKACDFFCPQMYKKCRKTMGQQSAICHQLTEFCSQTCCANFCAQ